MTLPVMSTSPTRLATDFVFIYVAPLVPTTGAIASQILGTSGWGSPLPNVIGHNSSEDANDEEWRHYGTGPQTELDIIEYPVSLSLEASAEIDELGAFLGFLADETKISLAESALLSSGGKVHIAQVGYTSTGTVVEVEYWSAVQWTSLGSSASAGTSVTYKGYELSGKATQKYITDGSEGNVPGTVDSPFSTFTVDAVIT